MALPKPLDVMKKILNKDVISYKPLEIKRQQQHPPYYKPRQSRHFSEVISNGDISRIYVTEKIDGWFVSIRFFRFHGVPYAEVRSACGKLLDYPTKYMVHTYEIPPEVFDLELILHGELHCTVKQGLKEISTGFCGVSQALAMMERKGPQNPNFKLKITVFEMFQFGKLGNPHTVYGAYFPTHFLPLRFVHELLKIGQDHVDCVRIKNLFVKENVVYLDEGRTQQFCLRSELKEMLLQEIKGEGYVVRTNAPASFRKCHKEGVHRNFGSAKVKKDLCLTCSVSRNLFGNYIINDISRTIATVPNDKFYLMKELGLKSNESCKAKIHFTWASIPQYSITGVHYAQSEDRVSDDTPLSNLMTVLSECTYFMQIQEALVILKQEAERIGYKKEDKAFAGAVHTVKQLQPAKDKEDLGTPVTSMTAKADPENALEKRKRDLDGTHSEVDHHETRHKLCTNDVKDMEVTQKHVEPTVVKQPSPRLFVSPHVREQFPGIHWKILKKQREAALLLQQSSKKP